MNYTEAIHFLYDQLPMFQRTGPSAYKDNLDNTLRFDDYFNHPHRRFKTIHVAGTNGKGSVSHMIASILQEAGLRTGLYTSPHLRDFRERIRVNGQMIEEDEVAHFVNNHRQIIEDIAPSFFEMTVAMAFDYFERQKVDVAVIEVGLGGRLDSTNIISPELSVITNIGLDHMSLLGNTLAAIAVEKGGIIKKNVPVVVGQHQPETIDVFKSLAENNNSPFYLADAVYDCRFNAVSDVFQVFNILKNGNAFLDDIKLPLLGKYQIKNVQTVCAVVEQLQAKGWLITEAHFRNGLAKVVSNTGLMGRWQILGTNPLIICDTGHNEDGIREVVAQIKETLHANLHFVFGVVNDKSINGILELLPQHATYYFTKANIPRSLDPTVLKSTAEQYGLVGNAYFTVIDAFNSAKKNAGINDLIFIGGSTFVVAEVI
jgi:dihydrofolate synthase/folylpolyglutamate synthase